jgi:hypothetical protein
MESGAYPHAIAHWTDARGTLSSLVAGRNLGIEMAEIVVGDGKIEQA